MISSLRRASAWLAVACIAAVASPNSYAAIMYGDFSDIPPGFVMYLDVTESSGAVDVPPARYGQPTVDGNDLNFNPKQFVADAGNGLSDFIDVQLNFWLMAMEDDNGRVSGGLTSLVFDEGGDFTLAGSGTSITSIGAGVSALVTIMEVDGVALAEPIEVFASSSITKDLVADGPAILAGWSNGLFVDFVAPLASNNVDYDFGVTKATVRVNDQLLAFSEPGSRAFIAKKKFNIEPGGNPNPNFNIPEPTAMALMASLLVGACVYRRFA